MTVTATLSVTAATEMLSRPSSAVFQLDEGSMVMRLSGNFQEIHKKDEKIENNKPSVERIGQIFSVFVIVAPGAPVLLSLVALIVAI
jgi:hypothetical protein